MTDGNTTPITRGHGFVAGSVVLFTFASMTLCARLWVRFKILGRAGWDDYLIVAAMVRTLPWA